MAVERVARTPRRARAGRPAFPRILVLAEDLPYPAVKGGDLRTWQNVNALAPVAEVAVFGLCSNDTRRYRVPDLGLTCWRAARDPALASPPPVGVRLRARAWLFDPGGHPSDLYFSESAALELVELIEELRVEVVLVEGLWLRRYIPFARALGCRIVLDCHNVEAAISDQLAAVADGEELPARTVRNVLPARTRVVEAEAVGAADQVWVCSAEDEAILRELYEPSSPVVVVPNGIRVDGPPTARRSDGPLTIVYPAFFSHPPNELAAAFLVDEIFPRLVAATAGDCRLHLVGAAPAARLVRAAARDDRIVVTGAVTDVAPWLASATAMPVPLFQGGGTRLKVLEAFAAGLPVVSTPKGVEGLGVQDGTHVRLAETADEFVEALVELRRDGALAKRLAAEARTLVERRFSWETTGALARAAILTASA